jgi:Cys-tRNA(Pro)/Cys-tRNA(Cys) deacylase
MIHQKELFGLTGYIHGGCSPVGMKKLFRTFIDETAVLFDTICVSGGKVGMQVEVNPQALAELVQAEFIDLTRED